MILQDIVCFKKLNTKKKLDLSTFMTSINTVSYTHLRAHETGAYLVCRLLLEKKKN